jgi:PAS domain S-box-containing protein
MMRGGCTVARLHGCTAAHSPVARESKLNRSVWRSIAGIVLPYLLVAGLYIALSDLLLEALGLDAAAFGRISRYKGWAFVFVTAGLLALLLRRELGARGQMEEALRESGERLRLALDAGQLGTFDWDVVGGGIRWSRWHEQLWGFAEGEFDGRFESFIERIHPADRAVVQAEVQRSIAGRHSYQAEFRVQAPGQHLRWIAGQGEFRFDDGGRPLRMIGVVRDITSRRRHEDRLRELSIVIQRLSEVRDEGAVREALGRAARGLTAADETALLLFENGQLAPFSPGLDPPRLRCEAIARLAARTLAQQAPRVIADSRGIACDTGAVDGAAPLGCLALVPIRGEGNLGVLVCGWERVEACQDAELELLRTLADGAAIALQQVRHTRDLERRVQRRTAQLEQAKLEAEAADRVKSAFLATMSHELRTPLNSIIGFTGILWQQLPGPLNEEQLKQLGMVRDSARHLLALINDVLDLSKIEAGELRVETGPFDPLPVLRQTLALATPLAAAKQLALQAELSRDAPRVMGDGRRFEQVLINLLSNAVKFTERGVVSLEAVVENGQFEVRVRDTGPGIPAGDLETIFQPFQQLDSGLTRRHEGTGLGLAICRRLLELMGGTITADSVPGQGSEFVVRLPLEPTGV